MIGQGLLSEILDSLFTIVEKLAHQEGSNWETPLKSRSPVTLKSLRTVLQLMKDACIKEWNVIEGTNDPRTANVFALPDVQVDLDESWIGLYSRCPSPIDGKVAHNCVRRLLQLKSNTRIIIARSHVNDENVERAEKSIVTDIDLCVDAIVFFLSASNWTEIYEYTLDRLYELRDNPSDSVASQMGMEVVGLLFVDYAKLEILLTDYLIWIPHVKRSKNGLFIEYMLQHSIIYWIQSHPWDVVKVAHDEKKFRDIVTALLEHLYAQSEQHVLTTWAFMTILSSLVPDLAEKFLNKLNGKRTSSPAPSSSTNNSSSSSFKLGHSLTHSQATAHLLNPLRRKKHRTEQVLDSLEALKATDDRGLGVTSICYTLIGLVASSVYYLDPKSTIVGLAKYLYPSLLDAVYGSANLPDFTRIDILQSHFVFTYSVVNCKAIEHDIVRRLASDKVSVREKKNIVCGLAALSCSKEGHKALSQLINDSYAVFIAFLEKLTQELQLYEEKSKGSTINMKEYKWLTMSMTLALKLVFTYPTGLFGTCPKAFANTIVFCCTSTNVKLQKATSELLFRFIRNSMGDESGNDELEISRVSTRELLENVMAHANSTDLSGIIPNAHHLRAELDESHIIWAIFDGVTENIYQTSQLILQQKSATRLEPQLKSIKMFLKARLFISSSFETGPFEAKHSQRNFTRVLESAILLCLCSPHMDICRLALENMKYLVHELILNSSQDSEMSKVPMYADLVSHMAFATPMRIHKKLSKLLQKVDQPGDALIDAWKVIYNRWDLINSNMVNQTILDEGQQKVWRAYSGFLSSLMYPLLNPKEVVSRIPDNVHFKARIFVAKMVEFLVSSDTFVGKTAWVVLFDDSAPLVFHHVLEQINSFLDKCAQTQAGLTTVVYTQSAGVIMAMVDRLQKEDIFLSSDFGHITMKLMRFAGKIGSRVERIQMAIQVCKLLESIAKSLDTLDISSETPVRNEIVATLSQWLDRAVSSIIGSKQYVNAVREVVPSTAHAPWLDDDDHKIDLWLIRDAAVAVARALKEVMKNMSIDWVIQDTAAAGDTARRFEEFKRLFELYTNILNKITTFSPLFAETTSSLRSQVVACIARFLQSNVDVGLKIAMEQGFSPDPIVRSSFLEIFSQIVKENPNAEDMDGKGYEDFVDFFNSDMTATLVMIDMCPSTDADQFAPAMMKLLQSKGNELQLVIGAIRQEIINTSSSADLLRRNCVATKMLTLYANEHGRHYLTKVITPFVEMVVRNPEAFRFETNLLKLRSDNLPEMVANSQRLEHALTTLVEFIVAGKSHLPLSFYQICNTIAETTEVRFPKSKYVAVGAFFFLRFFCPPLVSPDSWGFHELPISKTTKDVLLEIAKTVKKVCTGGYEAKEPLFGQLMVNASPIAGRLREFVRQLSEVPKVKETDSRDVSPESDNLSGTSERQYSSSLESLELCRTQDMVKNESQVSIEPVTLIPLSDDASDSGQFSRLGSLVDQSSLYYLHGFLFKHKEEINHRLLSDFRRQRLEQQSQQAKTDYYNESMERNRRFGSIIRSLGAPPKANSINIPSVVIGTPSRLVEFMVRNEKRDMGHVLKQRVIQEGRTRNGYPIIVITLANYNREELDTELVIFRFFQLAFKVWNHKFYIFYDFTGCKPYNILSHRARVARDAMMADQWHRNLQQVYYFNVGTLLLSTVKNIVAHYSDSRIMNPQTVQYHFLTTRDINDHFDLGALNLDPKTQLVIKDYARSSKHSVSRVTAQGCKQVDLRLGTDYLQLESVEDYEIAHNARGRVNDVYHMSKISDVVATSAIRQGEFNLEIIDGEVITLVARNCQDIIRDIDIRRSKLGAVTQQAEDKTLGLKDAGAFLFNVGLANLCSTESSEVKAAAYNLVCNLAVRYDFVYAPDVCAGVGLGLPYNAVGLAESFSASVAQTRPELTFDFVMSFAQGYASLPADQIERSVVYLIPWMQNIAQLRLRPATKLHIAAWRKVETLINNCASGYLANLGEVEQPTSLVPDMSTGATLSHVNLTTAHLVVRTLIALSTCKRGLYSAFLVNVWPMLCVEESLTETLLDEIVAYAMCSYELVDPVLALQTTFPTLALCGTVLSRCRTLLAKPLPPSERSLVSHPNWLELVILTRMLSSLSFESLVIAETYLTEIFQLVTTFLYTGPYAFRLSLFKLLTNLLHAFICSPKLSRDQKRHLMQVWDQLENVKGLVFGLSDDTRAMTYDYFVIASAQHVSTCCAILGDIIRYAGTIQSANAWRARWSALTMAACMTNNPPLQCRSFIVLGSLARIEIDDNIVSRVLQVLEGVLARGGGLVQPSASSTFSIPSRQSNNLRGTSRTSSSPYFTETEAGLVEEYGSCIVACLVKMTESLNDTSQYNGRFFWLAIALISTDSEVLYKQGLALMQAHLRALDALGVFRGRGIGHYLLRRRRSFDSEWIAGTQNSHIRFTDDNFHVAVAAHLIKGLERDKTREATLSALGTLLELCVKNEGSGADVHYLCYLYFLYLGAQTSGDIESYLWITGSPEDESQTGDVPVIIEKFINSRSTSSILTLVLGATLFLDLTEESPIATKYLDSLAYIDHEEDKACMVYSIMRPTLLRLIETSDQEPLLRSISALGARMLTNLDNVRRLPLFRHKLYNLLTQEGFEGYLDSVDDTNRHASGSTQQLHRLILAIVIDPDA